MEIYTKKHEPGSKSSHKHPMQERALKILLVSPKMSLRHVDSEYKRRMGPPLSLLTLAALTPTPHRVELLDENVRHHWPKERPDLVGITVNVDTAYRAYAIAAYWRSRKVPVVLGGIHVSALPEEGLEHADAVCVGEAEGQWSKILAHTVRGEMGGIYRNEAPADLASLPILRRDLIKRNDYLFDNTVYTSRGCPFQCAFCYNSCAYAFQQHRSRSAKEIIAEIQGLKVRHVLFVDDNFIGNPHLARQLCEAMRPLDLVWHAAASVNIVKQLDLLDCLAEAGCRSLFIGFESVNPASLQDMHKFQNRRELYEKLVSDLHQRNIMVNASLVFGFDEDGPGVFQESLDWLVAQRIETMTAHILTPYPGTQLYQRMLAENRIVDFDWAHYNTSNVVYKPAAMSQEDLQAGYLWIYRKFYSLANIWRRMPVEKANRPPYLLFNLGYRKSGPLTAPLMRFGMMRPVGAMARFLAYGSRRITATEKKELHSGQYVQPHSL